MKVKSISIFLSALICEIIAGDFTPEYEEIQKWEDFKVSFE